MAFMGLYEMRRLGILWNYWHFVDKNPIHSVEF